MDHFFSNKSWLTVDPDSETREILKHWQTEHTSIFFHLTLYIVMLWWTSALASTIPVPSGVFIPVFKMGAAFGRIVGELTHLALHGSVAFGASRIPIVPGGYAVVGAAAFAGAVTHTISTTVIVFELTGQMTHIIPVIAAVLIANAIAQSLKPSIYDSIIQIKQLPFLPPIMSTGSVAHLITAQDFMVRDVVCVWIGCSYKQLRDLLGSHARINCFPLVESRQNMILLGSVQRHELAHILSQQLGRERRLQEFQRRYSTQDGASRASISEETGKRDSVVNGNPDPMASDSDQMPAVVSATQTMDNKSSLNPGFAQTAAPLLKRIGSLNRKSSRFAVTQIAPSNTGAPGIVSSKHSVLSKSADIEGRPYSPPPASAPNSPKSTIKSILKPNVSYTISPHSTLGHGKCFALEIKLLQLRLLIIYFVFRFDLIQTLN
jgi:chloride channel 2